MNIKGYINKIFPILPLVYDDTLSFMELVSKLMKKTNEVVEVANQAIVSINGLEATDGELTLTASDVGALPDTYDSPVVSVNGAVGVVELDAEDVGALPDSTVIPTKTSELENDSGFITEAQAGAVTSVNGEVGAVVLDADDVEGVSYSKAQTLTAAQMTRAKQNIGCQPSSTIPSALGVASAGQSDNYARGDHVHPVPAGLVPSGGSKDAVLIKSSNTDYDSEWAGVTSQTLATGCILRKYPGGGYALEIANATANASGVLCQLPAGTYDSVNRHILGAGMAGAAGARNPYFISIEVDGSIGVLTPGSLVAYANAPACYYVSGVWFV